MALPTDRITDPTKIPVQINFKVPFDFREFLYNLAAQEGTSLSALVSDALTAKYGPAFRRANRPPDSAVYLHPAHPSDAGDQ